MFIDSAKFVARGGKGGAGCRAFRREKYAARGGPDGGDGGDGGSVHLVGDTNLATLLDFAHQPLFAAKNGGGGMGKNQHGRNGESLRVKVPLGTIVIDDTTGMVLRDITQPGETVLIAQGGKGGFGNKHYASATHRTPQEFQKGEVGEERVIRLELKLIADIGFVGMPNAGKSTLLSRLSDAHPKIADYPFTTTEPQLGIAQLGEDRRIVLADLPGLIEGAHSGRGLGDEFLRHIERTRVICQVVDMAPLSGPDPVESYRMIRKELRLYSPDLGRKPHIIAANKLDVTEARENLKAFRRKVRVPILPISAVTGEGLDKLMVALVKELDTCS